MQRQRLYERVSKAVPLFILYIILLAAPCALSWNEDGSFHFAKLRFLTGILASISIATLLCVISSRKRIRITISAILVALTFIEVWTFVILKTRISEKIVALIAQTDSGEASEFFSAYVLSPKSTTLLMLVVCSTVLIAFILKKLWAYIKPRVPFRVLLYTLIAANLLSVVCILTGIFTSHFYNQISYPTVEQLIFSLNGYGSHCHDLASLEHAVENSEAKIADGATPPQHIIWVIGESYNKHHASVYGYRLLTTPRLERELIAGNLLVFDDVTTPSSSTGAVMEYIFSTHADGESLSWQQCPLLPPLFRKAGYKVSLHDNQTTMLLGDPKWDASNMHFFNSRAISDASFDYRNDSLAEYDFDFVAKELPYMPDSSPTLSIFHLMGQHMLASKRYPPEAAVFDFSDYGWRTDLDDRQKAELAHYDNATVYNDSVIGLIFDSIASDDAIVIYHSDHGEEIHDFRRQYGRTLEAVTPEIARCIYQIPFVVYTTPLFRQRHPETYRHLVEVSQKPFSIADISHFLLNIASIEYSHRKPDRSLASN